MSSFALLCYDDVARWLDQLLGKPAEVDGLEKMSTGAERRRILMIGNSSPLLEGVSDLLQVVGYPVDMSSTWVETEYAMVDSPADLVIIDLSVAAPDGYLLAEQIRGTAHWSEVPILFVSFSGDDRIRELQGRSQRNGDRRLHFYAHTLLSIDGLLEEVKACLS
jgi:CheY-like chemotaxis protein